jgi:Zn-dependent protease with chaperone function
LSFAFFGSEMELEQQAKFDLLVRRLERSVRQQTFGNYQLRVAAIAAIGYGYIGSICLALFSSLWMLRWLMEVSQRRTISIDPNLFWMLFGLVALTIFWVEHQPIAKDLEIQRADFPELFATIDELRDRLKAPKIHHVIISYDHNAAVYQTPRLGWLGWYRNYLLLGLPLMQSLTPAQFQATLAHELGHLAGNDNLFVSWILRVRQIWERLTFDNNLFIFQWFFRWYEPLIRAHSFVLVRDREYAADALAKRIAGREIAASDLIQTYIYQHYLQETFSRQLDCQACERETPPDDVVTQMLAALRQPLDPQIAQIWLGLILGEATDTDDTHPCLSDRLAAVGYASPISWTPQPLAVTAAEHYCGDRLAALATKLDLAWQEQRQAAWLHQYQQAQHQREYLDKLTDLAAVSSLTIGEATSQAELTTILHGELLALPLWQAILARQPHHPQANYQVGKTLVNSGENGGCAYLERAIELDPDLVIPSCEVLYRFYTLQGNLATAEIYLDWRQQHLPKQWRSKLERKLTDTDRFVPHDLEPEVVNEIRNKLTDIPLIDRAYLVCKPMRVFSDRPLYILGLKLTNFTTDRSRIGELEADLERALCDRLHLELNISKPLVIATFDSKKSHTDRQDLKLIDRIASTPHANLLNNSTIQ